MVVHQQCTPLDFENPNFVDCPFLVHNYIVEDLNKPLLRFNVDIDKSQYVSETDKQHTWKNHVVNHLEGITHSRADYIVFADSDCWIINQPHSWVGLGCTILESHPDVFMVSPNDGEEERKTQVISQQMFLVRTSDFRNVNWNQPGYTGNPRDYQEMPEYMAMLEGRIHFYCKTVGKYRYVLPPKWRYWHHNRINPETDYFETDLSKY